MPIQYRPIPEFETPNLNLMGSFAQGQAMASNALVAQERERKLADIARTNAFLSQNSDLTKPGLAQAAIQQGIDPTNIIGLQKGALEVESERAQLHGRQFDNLAKLRDRLQQDIMGVNSQADADALFARYGKIAPDLLPPNRMFTPENKRQWMMNTAQFLEASKPYERTYAGPDGQPVTGRFYLNPITQQEVPVGGAERKQAEEWSPLKDASGNITGYQSKYGTNVISPEEFQQRQYTMAREGTGKNPRSSAEGLGQFIDSTFVDTYRKTFPDRAKGMSKEAILAQRGTMVDGAPVEEPMLQAFTAANQQKLRDAGFQPSRGNTYLAHFAGPDGAIDVLSASPDTPVTELLSPRAIKANPEVFSKVKTAGDLIRWAGGAAPGGRQKVEGLREPLQSYRPAPIGTEDYTAQKSALKFLDAIEYDPETGANRPAQLLEGVGGGRPTQVLYGLARAFGVSTGGTRGEARLSSGQKNALLAKVGDNMGGRSFTDEDRRFVMDTIGGLDDTAVPVGDRLARFDEAVRMFTNRAAVPYKAAPQLERLQGLATPAGAAAERPSRGQAGEVAAPVSAPPAAVEYLRKNPNLASAFDAKYGPGMAAKILGR